VHHSTAPKTGEKIGAVAGAIGCLVLVGVGVCWVYAIYDFGNSVWQVYLLKSSGQPAVAHVTGYTPKKVGRHSHKVHFHTVEFDGHAAKVRLPGETPVGTEINVLYLPATPEVVTAGTRDDSFLTLYGKARGRPALADMMCCGWVFFLWLFSSRRHRKH
jgi:hypothetical protein